VGRAGPGPRGVRRPGAHRRPPNARPTYCNNWGSAARTAPGAALTCPKDGTAYREYRVTHHRRIRGRAEPIDPGLFFAAAAIEVNGAAARDVDLMLRWDFPTMTAAYVSAGVSPWRGRL
jgi:hypothetical protein